VEICRESRVWGDARQTLVGRAAKKLPRAALLSALEHAAKVDRVVKGVIKGDAWDELLQLGLRLAS
jgi:DNA polymerase-3 subunit delta